MKWIFLGNDSKKEERFLLVDDESLVFFENTVLNISRDGYAKTQRTQDFAHRIILNLKKLSPDSVIFLNGNKLDCRKVNIMNRREYLNTLKKDENNGVVHSNGRWLAKIYINNQTIHLGSFDTEGEARAAYIGACRALKQSINDIPKPDLLEPSMDEKREAIAYRWALLFKLHKESQDRMKEERRRPITNEKAECFNSAYEAAKFYKRSVSTLRNHLNGYTKTAWGLKWEFIDKPSPSPNSSEEL